ncbi:hypothetical protein MWN33_05740 [Starkeya koreensis]|uniref:Uncharacterized protein n=1 Tax=Ancylobacter koreensis TaxID=266121 RepID=A0ABT0DJR2_9HYPH|nr:hypothetical protein [Ancylobacter koreensis]MCK0207533.1 hypothetical protein [Ancylobacter koreensis]
MSKPTFIRSADLQEATGASRGELLGWRQYLKFPMDNDAPGKSARYSLINGIEYTLMKACVMRGIPHDVAADFIHRRLTLAINGADHHRLAIATSVISHPAEWLEGTEFDVLAEPWFGAEPIDAVAFWCFDPQRNFNAEALHDSYLHVKEWGPRWQAERDRLDLPEGHGPISDPLQALKEKLCAAAANGEIVVEVRGPIRRFYAFAYGSMFIPGDRRVAGEGR